MTLSSWIRDYLFTPLVFATRNKPMLQPVWLLGAMAVCGLWHGAAWTFLIWGIWHGLLLLLNQTVLSRVFPKTASPGVCVSVWPRVAGILLTFVLVHVGWVFFRAPSVNQALGILHHLIVPRGGLRPTFLRENDVLFVGVLFVGFVLAHLWEAFAAREGSRPRSRAWSRWVRPLAYASMIVAAIVFDKEATAFVYFQF
jgi:alginate O-acetyltransferase complex protein AlgI